METATSGAATVDRPEEAHLVRDVAGVGARLGKGHKEETEYEPDGKSAGVAPSRKLPGPATAAGPAEARPWHRDPFHRVTVVLSGDLLNIDFRDGGEAQSWKIRVGEVDWAEPSDRVHRAVNVGKEVFEKVVTFFLGHPEAPQPEADSN